MSANVGGIDTVYLGDELLFSASLDIKPCFGAMFVVQME